MRMLMTSRPLYCDSCGRVHSVSRPHAVRYEVTAWDHVRDVAEIVAGLVVALLVIAAIALALFVWSGAPV